MNTLGKIIYEQRKKEGLTQDAFGKRYDVSGPAIFKFEKGHVTPSFKLWMRMAAEFSLSKSVSVLLWAKAKVPSEYRDLLELKSGQVKETEIIYKSAAKRADYARIANRDRLRETLLADRAMPNGLRDLVADPAAWDIYKPTGREITQLWDTFGTLQDGNPALFREALLVMRGFAGKSR